MNSTKWVTLTEFVKYLGKEGIVRVDETEKGFFISWVDNSPGALARQVSVSRLTLYLSLLLLFLPPLVAPASYLFLPPLSFNAELTLPSLASFSLPGRHQQERTPRHGRRATSTKTPRRPDRSSHRLFLFRPLSSSHRSLRRRRTRPRSRSQTIFLVRCSQSQTPFPSPPLHLDFHGSLLLLKQQRRSLFLLSTSTSSSRTRQARFLEPSQASRTSFQRLQVVETVQQCRRVETWSCSAGEAECDAAVDQG